MNKLIQLFPRFQTIGGVQISLQSFAILETPCYPASWYFGPVQFCRDPRNYKGEWITADNATSNFHRSLQEAQTLANQMFRK